MKPELLFENTWYLDDEGVRIFILAGSEKALIIDTGRSGMDVTAVARTVTSLPLELLNTHADPDHIAGNGAFDHFYMHPSESPVYYNRSKGKGRICPVYDGDVIDLGARELEIIHVPGHTPGSITLFDREHRCMIGGDPVQNHGRIYMFGTHRDLHSYVCGLEKLDRITSFDRIYPSHADLTADRSVIPQLIRGANQILNGEAKGTETSAHGHTVTAYKIGENTLLCDMPETVFIDEWQNGRRDPEIEFSYYFYSYGNQKAAEKASKLLEEKDFAGFMEMFRSSDNETAYCLPDHAVVELPGGIIARADIDSREVFDRITYFEYEHG